MVTNKWRGRFGVLAIGCAALALASCEFGMHARLDDYGRVIRSTSKEFCIKPEGQLRDDDQLCARQGASEWSQFSKGECVHLYVVDPDGKVQKVRPSAQCEAN
jgi:hypothetical protein